MIEVQRVGPAQEEQYLERLNTCFPRWGGAATFAWAFRQAHQPSADLFVLVDGDHVLAGSALTYRSLLHNGRPRKAACMTASWTLPEARGRGLFTRVIEASLDMARARECDLLMAYVRHSNPSYRALAKKGARMIASGYATVQRALPDAVTDCTAEPVDAGMLWSRRSAPAEGFCYDYSWTQWLDQFVSRPARLRACRLANGALALIAHHAGHDQLLALDAGPVSEMLHGIALVRGLGDRNLTLFASRPGLAEALAPVADVAPGSIALFGLSPSGSAGLADAAWHVDDGDRM